VQAASPFGHGLRLDRALAEEVIVRRNDRVMEQCPDAQTFDDPQTG
jgi:ABC-type microcin C transport system duplicated ATPase subunit YejF|tara:strand:- start:421 stop:558 length:138 start_codon:yes stop_codon:yes gene_type:complete